MKPTVHIVVIGLLSALLVIMQVALAFLPNVELVSLLFIIYGLTLPLSSNLLIGFVFVVLEALVWGMGDWVFGYLWIWLIWIGLIYTLKPILKTNPYFWALTSGLWGILFGLLFAINHGLFYGFNYSLIYWIRSIPFDITHTISNYVITFILFKPLHELIQHFTIKLGGFTYERDHKNR